MSMSRVHARKPTTGARSGRVGLVHMLLEAGAHVNAQGGVYENALVSAQRRGHEEVAEVLQAAGVREQLSNLIKYSEVDVFCRRSHCRIDHLNMSYFSFSYSAE